MDEAKDLERVKSTLEVLQEYWLQRPYLRLGQIVSNAWRVLPEYSRNPEPEINDIYYLPDNRITDGLSQLKELEKLERERQSKGSTQA
jgi:hypothetical protein